jgi:hypothetical protein
MAGCEISPDLRFASIEPGEKIQVFNLVDALIIRERAPRPDNIRRDGYDTELRIQELAKLYGITNSIEDAIKKAIEMDMVLEVRLYEASGRGARDRQERANKYKEKVSMEDTSNG